MSDQDIYIEWFREATLNGVEPTPEIAFMAALKIMTAIIEQREAELARVESDYQRAIDELDRG